MGIIKKAIKKTRTTIEDFRGTMKAMKKKRKKDEKEFLEYSKPHVERESNPQEMRLHIPAGEVAKILFIALLFVAGVFFVAEIRTIVLIFFVSLLFAAALDPAVDWMEGHKIPRGLGVLMIYVAIFGVLGIFVGNFVPLIASEIGDLAVKLQSLVANIARGDIELPSLLEGIRPFLVRLFEGIDVSQLNDYKDFLVKFADKLTDVGRNVVNAIIVTFNGFLNTILVLVLTFLMAIDEEGIDKFILSLFPARYAQYITEKNRAVKEKIGHWLRGQLMLIIAVGVLTYIGFFVIGLFGENVQYATTLAMFAGITEIVPVVGPVLAWMIALPIVANQSLALVLWVTVVFVAVQQLENNLLVPIIMNKAVGLSPIFVIIAVLIGFEFLGILGMVIAIPVATSIAIFVKDYADKEK